MGRIWQFKDYRTELGDLALSVNIHINDAAGDVRDPFDIAYRRRAMRASSRIADLLMEIAEKQNIQRDLVSGPRIDPRKRHAVGVAMRKGFVDPVELRPYQRRTLTLDLPSIVVVGSLGVAEFHIDPDYGRRISSLALAIGWACEITGAETRAYLMTGHARARIQERQTYARAQLAYSLISPERPTDLEALACLRHDLTFYSEDCYGNAANAEPESRMRMARLQGRNDVYWGRMFPSRDGGYGVHWARTLYQPDIVIGIGNLLDNRDADISLPRDFSIERATDSIVEQLRAYKARL